MIMEITSKTLFFPSSINQKVTNPEVEYVWKSQSMCFLLYPTQESFALLISSAWPNFINKASTA